MPPGHPTSFLSFSSSASFSVSKALVRLMDFCKEAFSSSASLLYSDSLKNQRVKQVQRSTGAVVSKQLFQNRLESDFSYCLKKRGVRGKLQGIEAVMPVDVTYCAREKRFICIGMQNLHVIVSI